MTGTVPHFRISELTSFNLDSLTCNVILHNCENMNVIMHGKALDFYIHRVAQLAILNETSFSIFN